MKKIILAALPLVLAACTSTPTQQSSVPMDMKAVQEYQAKVASGKTVNPNAKQDDRDLNHSDRTQTIKIYNYGPRYYPYGWYYY